MREATIERKDMYATTTPPFSTRVHFFMLLPSLPQTFGITEAHLLRDPVHSLNQMFS